MHPRTRTRLLHVIANQCAHWCGNPFSPQRGLASWLLFWQIRSTFRIRLKYCSLLCAAARRTDCPVASLLAIITCFHTTINENVIYWRYGRSLMSYPRSGRRILQPFQFGKEDQLLSEKTTKSRLAAPNICYGLSIIQPKKPGPVPGQFPAPFFGRSLPYFHNNDRQKPAVCQHSAQNFHACFVSDDCL